MVCPVASTAVRDVSHIHRNQTETITVTKLHRFVFGRPFTNELNPRTIFKKMHV